MKGIYQAIIIAFIALVFFGCQKEISSTDIGNGNTGSVVKTNIQGNIIDQNNQPLVGVSIQVGGKTATTNAKGYFRITGVSLDRNSSLVTAVKNGYFRGYRSFSATTGTNQVMIKLIKKNLAGSISSSGGGEIAVTGGAKINFTSGSIVSASSGNPYSGQVNVYATSIDPTSPDIDKVVPGSFMADNKENKRVLLSSYGMMAVELESPAGEKLQVKSGQTAKLFMPVPSSLLSSAPATIPMWYVDEQTGIWKEEGTATKVGDHYEGEVKHFSFWNCDVPMNAVHLSLQLKDNEGKPLVYVTVKLSTTAATSPSQAYGITDSAGQVGGMIPAAQALLLEVLDPCNNAVYSRQIGPFNQNTDLGLISVSPAGSSSILTVKGKLVNCSNAPVTNGFAMVSLDNVIHYAATDGNGNFSATFITCPSSSSNVQVLGIDASTGQQSSNTNIQVSSPVTNTGNISACGTATEQYINYTIDGVNHNIVSPVNDSIMINYSYPVQGTNLFTTVIQGRSPVNSDFLTFNFDSPAAPGTYGVTALGLNSNSSVSVNLLTPFNVTLLSFAQTSGAFYEGDFSGQYKDAQNQTHTINCSFKVRRS